MLSSKNIQWIKSLHQKKVRYNEGYFVAEGEKIVRELMDSDWQINGIIACEDWASNNGQKFTGKIEIVNAATLARISQLTTPNQAVAIVKMPEYLAEPEISPRKWYLLLDHIQDPGNMGTIIRTAEWFGINEIFCTPDTADIYNEKVIQASMGSFLRVKVYYKEPAEFLNQLPPNTSVLGAVLDGTSLYQTALPKGGILVIGNESNGISNAITNKLTHKIYIPRHTNSANTPESLNAAIASAIILAEIVRS